MNIAHLNMRITIQRNSAVVDDIGNHRLIWTDWFSCYATVSNESNAEAEDAGTTVDNTNADFTVRYSSETAAVTPTEYRVVMDGQVYDILSVDHMNYNRKSVKLKCRKARR
jgi:SPP1 family predicted phage head-tail adaptor